MLIAKEHEMKSPEIDIDINFKFPFLKKTGLIQHTRHSALLGSVDCDICRLLSIVSHLANQVYEINFVQKFSSLFLRHLICLLHRTQDRPEGDIHIQSSLN